MTRSFATSAFAVTLMAALTACAPKSAGLATPPTAASLSTPIRGGGANTAMPGMNHSTMAGMDMNAMMAHCAEMRQQIPQGAVAPADMRPMLAQCDEMDRSMGMPAPRRR